GWKQVDRVSLDVVVGVGPGQAFGERWSELNAGQAVGLIPCAMGGTTIENWQRDEGASSLYGSMLRRCRAAAAEGEIRGVLFFQGESDAVGDRVERWAELFVRWAGDLRSDLGKPELPIVFAQLGDGSQSVDPAEWRRLQEVQAGVMLAQCAMITTSDLPLSDDVHFTTDGYREVGRRFAEAMHRLTRPAGIVSETQPSRP
ncbi:MAG TPA: sialate O-acetylesterase, partial [Caulifigura sp.]|nr:sialate O-acetylesterase [Caulifigura sp.]